MVYSKEGICDTVKIISQFAYDGSPGEKLLYA